MKKIINYSVLLLVSALILTSCEENVTGVELPYKEELVVRCILEEGIQPNNIRIERTLPPLEDYSVEKALVTDANAIISDGTNNYSLTYSNGYYYSNDLIPLTGKEYTLTVKWKGKTATARTSIPKKVNFTKVEFDKKTSYNEWGNGTEVKFYTWVDAEPNSVYIGGIASFWGSNTWYSGSISQYSERNSEGKVKVMFEEIIFSDMTMDSIDIVNYIRDNYYVVEAYEKEFYPYFITKYNGEQSNEIFGTSGTNVEWNIKGDGIGMFIGKSIVSKKF